MDAATVESPPSKPSPTKSPGGLVDRHASSLELAASSLRLVYLNQPAKNKGFVGNQVITAKYNLWTFVPAFCYERFTQVSNFYFLLVGVGQVIPAITSTFGLPYSWLVLGVVLFVDAIFTAFEDYHRHRADAVMNARETLVYDALAPSCFRSNTWKDIVVGDVIQVKKYEAVPADILLLAVHEADPESPVGMCFIETKSLDGETNLKIRQALGCTFAQLQDPASIAKLPGRVACEHPNHDVNNFMGRFEPGDASSMIPIDLKNVVLRGCVIRNTPFVYGLVLNTGSDTKIMQASHKTPNKLSKAIEIINRGNFILMVTMLLLCVLGAVWNQAWVMKSSPLYLQLDVPSIRDGLNAFRGDMMGLCIAFGYYWVLISSFVPITLYVSIAIVKSYQTYFMNRDLGMYYAATDTPAWVRNADLNDELGQITHIFSDKTGTLTANEMNFRKMSIHGRTYGRGSTDIGRATALRCGRVGSVTDNLAKSDESHPPHVEFLDPHGDFEKARRAENVHSAEIDAFLTHLSICHSVVLEKDDTTNETTFSASSPDELALVAGAAFFGYKFTERSNGRAVVTVEGRGDMEFQMLELIEFTSTRKRMSVVVRHPDGRILLLTKGADSIVFPRLARHSDEHLKAKTIEHMEMYAEEGLRTLVLAQRELGQDWYLTWSAQYKHVLANLDESSATYQAELAIVEQLEDEMERDLELLGATAVEDRLQNGVPQAISSLMSAGIKVWVLTGDKEETAINIAFACQLITNDMDRLILNMDACASDPNRLKQLMLEKAHRTRSSLASIHSKKGETLVPVNMRMQALVVDGAVLTMIYHYPLLKFLFLELAEQCCAVICCRVSPKQKAEVVSLVKNNIKGCRTLSIGDGANDVSMIQEAHVGVGISGHEGMQAVNASDFAIAQFAFLQRLLLVHGHWNYRRMARLVLYVVYKNILCWFTLFVLSLVASGSGTVYMNYNWLNGYNVFWTFLPIMILAIMEQETSETMAQDHPGLYHIGPHGYLLSVTILSQWVFEALYEGMVCALVPVLLMGQISSSGYAYSMYDCGGLAYTSLIVVGWAKLVLNTMSWNAGMHFAMWATLPFWFGSGIVLSDHFTSDSGDHSFPYQYTLPEFWMLLLLCIVLSLFRDFVFKVWKREWRPEYYHILQETEKYHLSTDTDWDPPRHRHNYKPFRVDFSHYLTSELHALPDAPWIELQQPKHRGFAFSIQPSENRHFNPVRSIVLAPIKRAVVRVLSPRSASQEEAAFWAKRKAEGHVYEYQRYQVFVGWSAPFGLTDPCHFGTRDMRDGALHGMPSPDIWMIDSSVGLADGKHWEYATKFRDFKKVDIATTRLKKPSAMQRKINKMVGRCVRRRRWILKPDYPHEGVPLVVENIRDPGGGARESCGRSDVVVAVEN